MKKYLLNINKVMAAATLLLATTVSAQQTDQTFKVMTLNVDGLPAKILVFNVNPDGPASAGSELISEYVAAKNCDIVAMQEDFNYRWEIWSRLFAAYNHDEWGGGILTEECKVDYAHLHRNKFPTDGLNMSWKKECQSKAYDRVAWEKSFGKFSHDFDDIVTKGFRRHEMTLQNGVEVVVYNMHMDASSSRDEKAGNDARDREARQSQWEQLRDHILSHMDRRPIIVMGDMNSLYQRDDVKRIFIDHINETGKATASDAWVELNRGGSYPQYGQTDDQDDMLDKVIYINPTDAETPVKPLQTEWDKTGYLKADGKPLGDHYPLIVTFTAAGSRTAINAVYEAQKSDAPAYTIQGMPATPNQDAVLIKNGKKRLHKGSR